LSFPVLSIKDRANGFHRRHKAARNFLVCGFETLGSTFRRVKFLCQLAPVHVHPLDLFFGFGKIAFMLKTQVDRVLKRRQRFFQSFKNLSEGGFRCHFQRFPMCQSF
jgi:hypothetical protein